MPRLKTLLLLLMPLSPRPTLRWKRLLTRRPTPLPALLTPLPVQPTLLPALPTLLRTPLLRRPKKLLSKLY
jgi:hypothetical protein